MKDLSTHPLRNPDHPRQEIQPTGNFMPPEEYQPSHYPEK